MNERAFEIDQSFKKGYRGHSSLEAPQTAASSTGSEELFLQRKASCACGGGCPSCATGGGLKVSHPNDAAEVEADRAADRVMRMPDGSSAAVHTTETAPWIQRKADGSGGSQVGSEISSRINASRGGGTGLDGGTRRFMESRFGVSFGDVRIHTDGEAARLSRSLGAQAFTHGTDIYFGEGQHQPDTDSGKHILAHELAHVAQGGSTIHRYRKKGHWKSIHHGTKDWGALKEDNFDIEKDIETKPWIKQITVNLIRNTDTTPGKPEWIGTAHAEYYKNPVKWEDFYFAVSAGSSETGNTTEGNDFTVTRLEGVGYMSQKYSGKYVPTSTKGWGKKYTDADLANMHWAIFFLGGEALHGGPRNETSHGCVHVDLAPIRQANYHSVVKLTKVIIKYNK